MQRSRLDAALSIARFVYFLLRFFFLSQIRDFRIILYEVTFYFTITCIFNYIIRVKTYLFLKKWYYFITYNFPSKRREWRSRIILLRDRVCIVFILLSDGNVSTKYTSVN